MNRRGERGLTVSVQWALLLPLLLGILVATCDAATWWHARAVLQQATRGAAESVAQWNEPGRARNTAQVLLRSTAAGPPTVEVTRDGGLVRVHVTTEIRLITGTRVLSDSVAGPEERVL